MCALQYERQLRAEYAATPGKTLIQSAQKAPKVSG